MPKSKTNSKSRSKSLRRRRSQKTQKNKIHRGGMDQNPNGNGNRNGDPAGRPPPPLGQRPTSRRRAVGNLEELQAELARRAAAEAEERSRRTGPNAGRSLRRPSTQKDPKSDN
jgi:hypothetical protein